MNVQVTKVGGAHLNNPAYLDQLAKFVGELSGKGPVVLVHGGGKEIGELHSMLEVPHHKALGLRVTSERSMDLVTMVLAGMINKRLVAHFTACGFATLGVSGADLSLLRSSLLNPKQLGRVGGPPRVDQAALERLLCAADVLVLAPVCLGPDGHLVNVNADAAAQAVAVAAGAEALDFITDIPAVRTQTGEARALTAQQIQLLIAESVISGGMIPKLQASMAALDGGVSRVRVGSIHTLNQNTATEVIA